MIQRKLQSSAGAALGDQAELLGDVHAQVGHHRVHQLGLAELEAR